MPIDIPQFILYLWMGIFVLWAVTGLAAKQTVQSRSEGTSRAAIWIVMFAWWILFDRRIETLSWRFLPAGQASLYAGLALTIDRHPGP
jgi:hypothetical protein